MSKKKDDQPIQLKEIASELHIPRDFLSKILQSLSRHGIVRSRKGRNGGFELVNPPAMITLNTVVNAIDGNEFLVRCVLGFPGCSDENACSVHAYWKESRGIINRMLNEESMEDLSKNIDGKLELLRSLSTSVPTP